MLKVFLVFVVLAAFGTSGCTSSTTSAWHRRIEQIPSTQPHDAVDPGTGELLWRDYADREFPKPLSREVAFQILLNTETFADAYIGYAGTKSAQVDAFQVLSAQSDAKNVFSDLLNRANTAGKLYALCGIYLVAPEKYADAEKRVIQIAGEVNQQAGCMQGGQSVREIIRCSDPNTVRLRRNETVKQWFERMQPPRGAAMYDISGGAIPEEFLDAR